MEERFRSAIASRTTVKIGVNKKAVDTIKEKMVEDLQRGLISRVW